MKTSTLNLRAAQKSDVPAICRIVNYWAGKGKMLPRKETEVLAELSSFAVLKRDARLLACGALAVYDKDLCELRSIAVDPKAQGEGLGLALCEFLIEKAKKKKFGRVFAFTYVPGFFEKLGLHIVDADSLPQKTLKDCRFCNKRENCDEIAMLRSLKS